MTNHQICSSIPIRRRNPRGGFTLVELLVVIGIIAILIAVSASGITSAIKFANTCKCVSNMHGIGIAFRSYLIDHNSVMPQRFYGNGMSYMQVLQPYGGYSDDKYQSIYYCPSHNPTDYPSQPSYGMNWYYDNTDVSLINSSTIMVAETAGTYGKGSNRADENSGDPGELATTRHNNAANYLFYDGSVKKLTYSATETPVDLWGTDQGNHNLQSPQ